VFLLSSIFNTCRISLSQPKREYRDRRDGSKQHAQFYKMMR
jgi:hypothetical protein